MVQTKTSSISPPISSCKPALNCNWSFICWAFAIIILAILAAVILACIQPDSLSPVILFEEDTIHLPLSLISWNIGAKCRASELSVIDECIWRQIKPTPDSLNNTVLAGGTRDCLTISAQEVDASLKDLDVPKEHGKYTFELNCTDDSGRNSIQIFDVLIYDQPFPIVHKMKTFWTIPIKKGFLNLSAECRALQGYIVNEWWEHIESPADVGVITPAKDGYINFQKPGVYKFKYNCEDSYGLLSGPEGSIVTITVRPPYVFGIDLGTSTTCVSFENEHGVKEDLKLNGKGDKDFCMPSVVAFTQNGSLLFGKEALNQAMTNRLSTIYDVKRLIGLSYYDDNEHIFDYRVRPTLKSHSSKGTRAAIDIPCGNKSKLIQPELISALILRHVVSKGERELGVTIKDVLITVPAQFNDLQRKATMDSARIAGLNPQKVVNEPTVAAFAAARFTDDLRGTEDGGQIPEPENATWSVVADIGGGTSDFALMQISGSFYKVVSTGGNKTLGGRDIDIRLTEIVDKIWRDKTTDPALLAELDNPTFQQNLRIECERAKQELSATDSYTLTVQIDVVNQGTLLLEHHITRDEFEKQNLDIFKRMIYPLDSMLKRVSTSAKNIEHLYLIGGTVQIPKLKQLLTEYFSNLSRPPYYKDPVQGVSRGAAVFGSILGGIRNATWMPKVDIIALPINIVVDHENMYEVFERNRGYPCKETIQLTTCTNNQTSIAIQIYEGQCQTHDDQCNFLGESKLSGIPPQPKGVPNIKTAFTVYSNGILNVNAIFESNGKTVMSDTYHNLYSGVGSMCAKEIDELSSVVRKLMNDTDTEPKCSLLENSPPMPKIPPKQNTSTILKITVDSEYGSVKMKDAANSKKNISAVGMVTVKARVLNYKKFPKVADLDFVLVVDTSSTMGLEKRMMTLIRLIQNFINILKDNHRLGIVTFNTNVRRVLELKHATSENKDIASKVVNSFETVGDTNTFDGLLTGLKMAYNDGGKRACVLFFTDGNPTVGKWILTNDILREIKSEKNRLKAGAPTSKVVLHTFGIAGYDDREELLRKLPEIFGNGNYHKVDTDSTELQKVFASIVSNEINKVATDIQMVISRSSASVKLEKADRKFGSFSDGDDLKIKIPSIGKQQSLHIPIDFTVRPTKDKVKYEEIFHVNMTYMNLITESIEWCDEYLYVARTQKLEKINERVNVKEQLIRVEVAKTLDQALKYIKTANRKLALKRLKEAKGTIQDSITKDNSLSKCLLDELAKLILMVEQKISLSKVEKLLEESSSSHWEENGGWNSCYVTRNEETMITLLKQSRKEYYEFYDLVTKKSFYKHK